jgi:uncharacterized repeat protein (TIGR01451 family)
MKNLIPSLALIVGFLLHGINSHAQDGTVVIIAGNGVPGHTGDGGQALVAEVDTPKYLALDKWGNIYFSGGDNTVRKINLNTGIISTIAGTGSRGFSGDGGPATAAKLNEPAGVSVDTAGNVYIGDSWNNRIRKVNTAGIISTVTTTHYNSELAVPDKKGNIYVTQDDPSGRILKVDPTGVVSVFAGGGASTADGVPATSASLGEGDLAFDNNGNLYVTQYNLLRKIDTNGLIYTVAGTGTAGYSGDGGLAINATLDCYPIAIDKSNNIYIGSGTSSIRKIDAVTGIITTVAGNNNIHTTSSWRSFFALGADFYDFGLTIDTSGNLFIADIYSNCVREVVQSAKIVFYVDQNGNCLMDSNEHCITSAIQLEVDSNGVVVDTISAMSAMTYYMKGVVGDVYTFKAVSLPTNLSIECPLSGMIYDTIKSTYLASGAYAEQYFGLKCNTPGVYDLQIWASLAIAGIADCRGTVYVANWGCESESPTVSLSYSPKYYFLDPAFSNPPASSFSGNTITWTLPAISNSQLPIQIYYGLLANLSYSPGLVAGDTIQTYASVTPVIGDINVANNDVIVIDTVRAGIDPNEMSVTPAGYITAGTQLQYTINFENTGTDTAYNIYIIDSLSDNVDSKSLNILFASAQMTTSMLHVNGHNFLKFDFPGIDLPDSSDHGACDGMVVFTVNTKNGLPNGTTIYNQAGIYFDNNPVVNTNQVEDIIGFPSSVRSVTKEDLITVYPNPGSDEVIINTGNKQYECYTITNNLGQTMQQQSISSSITKANISALPAGVYYVTLKSDNGSTVKKFVKM